MTSRHASTPDREGIEEPLDPLTEEALAWLVRLHSGSETEDDWARYQDWKAANAERMRAAATAEALWQGLGPALARKRPSKARRGLAAIAVLAVIAGSGAFLGGLFGPPAAYFADERTSVGERRSLTLTDGSRLELDAGTSLDVRIDASGRRLVLYAGEIFVTVAADPARPFVVEAGGGTTEALGTAFDVRLDGEAADVVVAEHAVRVAYPAGAEAASVVVPEGSRVAYAPATGLGRPEPADVRGLTAWRRGHLVFDGRPLGEVVAAMSRYRRGKILVTDASLGALPVTGIFATDDPDALLDAIADALPVRLRRLPWLTLVEPAPVKPRAVPPPAP